MQAEELEATISVVEDAVERGCVSWSVPKKADFFQRFVKVNPTRLMDVADGGCSVLGTSRIRILSSLTTWIGSKYAVSTSLHLTTAVEAPPRYPLLLDQLSIEKVSVTGERDDVCL